MKIDGRRICEVDNCNNLGDVDKVVNNKVYRKKLCGKHKKEKYGIKPSPSSRKSAYEKFKIRGLNDICWVCGWRGPCDIHRIEPQGKYNFENMMSTCPNCHRLIHRGLMNCNSSDPKDWKRNEVDFSRKVDSVHESAVIKTKEDVIKKVPSLSKVHGCGCKNTGDKLCKKHGRA